MLGDGGWVGSQPLGRPVALTLRIPLNLPLGGGGVIARGRGDGCCGRGYFCDGGGLGGGRGGSRTVATSWAKREGVGCCGEFRASPCSLRSRPPSRGEGGVLVYA